MTPSPLISVIIKTYNEEAGIADTISQHQERSGRLLPPDYRGG
ncbi:MAG: hypothetical protein ACRC9Y_03750 [Aeromonas veronii]